MCSYVIETKRLTKKYGEQTAVNAVNIHVEKGRIYGLLGRNGAGKTTIMKMILGLTPVTSGEIDVFGQNIKGREKRVYPRIGAIIETPGFYPNLTGTENREIFAKLRGTAPNAVKNALDIVGLPYRDKKLFSKYSLGMKQRLGIANAILHDPELLILDEPTNGLDPIGIAAAVLLQRCQNLCGVALQQRDAPRFARALKIFPRDRYPFLILLNRRDLTALQRILAHKQRRKTDRRPDLQDAHRSPPCDQQS